MGLLNDRIKSMRISRGYTLAYVAELLGIQEATVQRYESGEIKNIKHETIAKLAEILNCSPAYLMGWEEAKPDISFVSSDNEIIGIIEHMSPPKKARAKRLMQYYSKLNEIGQKKALDNIEDLAKIYAEKKTMQPLSMVAEKPTLYGSSDNVQNNIVTMRKSVVASDNSHLIPDAAHDRTDISKDERTDELIQQEDDIMDDPNF